MDYVELHLRSNFSFYRGASSPEEVLTRARDLGYKACALTDFNNLCGVWDWVETARDFGIRPIIGADLTLRGGSCITLLAKDQQGYSNLCRLLTYAHRDGDRLSPALNPERLPEHAQGLIAIVGCHQRAVPGLLSVDEVGRAQETLAEYADWFGRENLFLELQRHFWFDDKKIDRFLNELAGRVGLETVATNNVFYHISDRSKAQEVLTAIRLCKRVTEVNDHLLGNAEFYLKSPEEMARLFGTAPQAVANTVKIAERCTFDLSHDLGYSYPTPPMPDGHTAETYLRELCDAAAVRRYGSITPQVKERLDDEMARIKDRNMAGFLLLYRELVEFAREIMIEKGLADPEVPLEVQPPGTSRGSSVALLSGYLVGLSHIDPLKYQLPLDRCLPDGGSDVTDIDLDFQPWLQKEILDRASDRWGWQHVAITGMLVRYEIPGVIRDVCGALGLAEEDAKSLVSLIDIRHAGTLFEEIQKLPEFKEKLSNPLWRDFVEIGSAIMGFPKYLGQHVGGLIISTRPLIDMVPVIPAVREGRDIINWDRFGIESAGFAKFDVLPHPVQVQLAKTVEWIDQRTGEWLDLSRIDYTDRKVYEMIQKGDTIGCNLLQSQAQIQTSPRMMSKNLDDIAVQVAIIRPGVGVNGGASQYLKRRNGEAWQYDDDLEALALEDTYGIIVWQEQVVKLISVVFGVSESDADEYRRAVSKKNNSRVIENFQRRFLENAIERGVSKEAALKILNKVTANYMFPMSHSYAWGVIAYQVAYLKRYYPLEFYSAYLFAQPMGFYPLETIKEDARRHGVEFLNPDINRSDEKASIADGGVLIGLRFVDYVGPGLTSTILDEREANGPYQSVGDLVRRTSIRPQALEALINAGALDGLSRDRRSALWEAGLYDRPSRRQPHLALAYEDIPELPAQDDWELMVGEYESMRMYPAGHVMEQFRPHMPAHVMNTAQIRELKEGEQVTVVGRRVISQHPNRNVYFITIEDEYGLVQVTVWPDVFQRFKKELSCRVILVRGEISRLNGSFGIILSHAQGMELPGRLPKPREWR
ncbi:MAG: DNA polymerase III subunit alpha [Chloroflexi bacterium]|nr:DNA polymerase III subunit alpha [Chloroflexota bacterium]MCI0770577.1 DNA polymerase III subunit alpha [Chloroflexota bacterium]MCI0840401.1 DNA polymerase III subunit alpha [Chloroflexota bacterium]